MTPHDVMNMVGTVVGIIAGVGGFGVVVIRWIVRDTLEPMRVEMQALSTDIRITLAAIKAEVEAHAHRLENLEDKVELLGADKVSRTDLDRMFSCKDPPRRAHKDSED